MKNLIVLISPGMITYILLVLVAAGVGADMSDVDQMDMSSDTSSSKGMDSRMEGGQGTDPNIVNPQKGQGYGMPMDQNNQWKGTTQSPRRTTPPTPKRSFSEQSIRAVLELGIIIGVAFLVGGGFMAMVGMELLCDKFYDKYREIFKKPKELPDIERLHPAELVGTFSRYK